MLNTYTSNCFRMKTMFLLTSSVSAIVLFILWISTDGMIANELSGKQAYAEVKLCHVETIDFRRNFAVDPDKITIYFITPTYPRPEQIPEIKRLSYTLMHVENLHWIVADDSPQCNPRLFKVLRETKLPFTFLSTPMPNVFRNSKSKPRGVSNRRAAINWIRLNTIDKKGVIYFGDDDNTFDLELFEEIRATRKVSMFPVGLIGQYGISSPVVSDGRIIGFFDPWPAQRKWPVDMAGFAVNLEYLKPFASMRYKPGYEEDSFLISNDLTIQDIEPLAANCTRILVWHTKTHSNGVQKINIDLSKQNHNLRSLLVEATLSGMTAISKDGSHAYLTVNKHPSRI